MISFKHTGYKGAEMLPYERYKLYNWICDIKPLNVLEVGCGRGGATYYMAEAIKSLDISSTIFTCDPKRGLPFLFLMRYPFVKFFKTKSHYLIQKIITDKVDLDFIMFDGPDDSMVAMNDIVSLEGYIKDGTYFCMHDWEIGKRGYDGEVATKSQKIRPYIEMSEHWVEIEVLSGVRKNNNDGDDEFDSVGLCLYKYKK
jgi:SAM-dependent methyltransferase